MPLTRRCILARTAKAVVHVRRSIGHFGLLPDFLRGCDNFVRRLTWLRLRLRCSGRRRGWGWIRWMLSGGVALTRVDTVAFGQTAFIVDRRIALMLTLKWKNRWKQNASLDFDSCGFMANNRRRTGNAGFCWPEYTVNNFCNSRNFDADTD